MRLAHPMNLAVRKAMLTHGDFHAKVMLVARHLVRDTEPDKDEEIIELLFEATQRVKRRRMTKGEVGRIVDWLRNRPARSYEAMPKQDAADPRLMERVDSLDFGLERLASQSEPVPEDGRAVLQILYPNNPFICIGFSVSNFYTKRVSEWVEQPLDGAQYLAPNPMKAASMEKPDGGITKKCHDLVLARWYLAVEFDNGSADQQATRLAWLGAKRGGGLPLTLVTFSGSKSMHGLYRVIGMPERRLSRFYDTAIGLGADPALWTPSQFTRMPQGFHQTKHKRQRVYFLSKENAITRR